MHFNIQDDFEVPSEGDFNWTWSRVEEIVQGDA